MPALIKPRSIQRPPQDPEELWWLVRALWGFSIPVHQVCPHHVAPFEAFCSAYFAWDELCVWKGSRGFGGKSTLLAILSLTEQVCLGASVTILGGSLLQSERVHDVMSKAWDYPTAPSNLLIRAPTKQITRLTNQSTAVALAASQRSIRGPHPQRLRCIAEGQLVETHRGPLPIEQVQAGDLVIGVDGQRLLRTAAVTAVTCNGIKETFRLTFDDGQVLVCTEGHPILTPVGYRRAEILSVGDFVLTCDSFKSMQVFSEVSLPGEPPIPPPHFPRVLSLVQRDRPVDKPVSLRDRDEFPPLPGQGRPRQDRGATRVRFTKQDALALVGHGVLFALKMLSGGRPSVAVNWLSRLTSNLPDASSTQETPESQRSVSPVEPAKSRLVKVELAGMRRVWDLTVPKLSSFVAEGIIVHNCDEVDEMDWEVYEGALGQPISAPGIPTQVVASSTYHNPRGTMWRVMEQAKAQGYPVYEWCVAGSVWVSTPSGPVQMRELEPGDKIYSLYIGQVIVTTVEDHWCSGSRGTVCIQSDLGNLLCTLDHRVYTDKGWKLAGQVKVSDLLLGLLSADDSEEPIQVHTPVRHVHPGPQVPVYDLTVAKGSSFFAAGVLVHNCYRETAHPEGGWLNPGEVDSARRRMSSRRFSVEYDLQEPTGEATAIMKDKVDQCFKEDSVIFKTIVSLEDEEHYLIEPPMPGGVYATGADWGRRTDWCVFCTFRVDVSPIRCVHWVRIGRQSWPDLIARLDDVMTRYGGSCVHDGTGIGDVIDDFVAERGESMEAVWLSGKLRQTIFEEYIVAIENDQITYPRLTYAYNEHLDCTTRDLYGAGHPPDSFVAGALAYRARLLAESDEEFF